MSKSQGNVIDPLVVTEQFGTDAVRFTLAIMAAPGTDISLSKDRMLGYRAFANKIWNATRFVLLNLENIQARLDHTGFSITSARENLIVRRHELALVDRWILSRLNGTVREINEALEACRFHEASHCLYHFFWHELCDWYIELVKPKIVDKEEKKPNDLSCEVLIFVFDQALRLLHPFMPFITEELWQRLPHEGQSISIQEFPKFQPEFSDEMAEKHVGVIEDVIVKIRNMRAEKNVDPVKRIQVNLGSPETSMQALLTEAVSYIQSLGRCEQVTIVPSIGQDNHSVRAVASGVEIALPLAGMINLEEERLRIQKEIYKIEKEMEPVLGKLKNREFLTNAPEKVVKLNQARVVEFQDKLAKLNETLKQVSGA